MKNMSIGAAVIVALLIGGFFWLNNYIYQEKQGDGEPTPTGAGAKIDPRVACESALAYTTFTDGAAAEAFVADCIAGKHPEVIEQYIQSMGVDGAAI